MTLIIEDGTIVPNANSYITVVEYSAWADSRFGSSRATAPADEAATESLILRAMDYFENLSFRWSKVEREQPLHFPRSFVVIDGYGIDAYTIPKEVKNALFELTYAEETGVGELNQIKRKTISETIGPISRTFASGSSSRVISPSVGQALRKLTSNSGSNFRVYR